jgi:flavin reductase (DIM6/NTAB) family NADH-FMN oxidoreductase RutF
MKRKLWILGAVASATALVSACNDGGHAGTMPATSTVQRLDTAQVLAIARQPSETGEPFAVDQGALMLTDTSETSEPVTVNAM